jgi:cytochrome b6-f complex iron-sulfur subunit
MGWGSLATFVAASCLSTLRFFFPNVLYEPPATFKAGYPEEYKIGEVSERFKEEHKVWIYRSKKGITAYLALCTHLGCTPHFRPENKTFFCGCHGGVFNLEGDPIAGPPPIPLYRLGVSLAPDGKILVDKNLREADPKKRDKEPYLLVV